MPGFELIDKKELNEIKNIFNNGSVLFRHGFERLRKNIYKVRRFEENFKKKIKSKYSLAVTSGTSALRVALEVLDLKPNDEVITQCFTFVATVEAIIESGAKPVCTDVDKTLNMDPNDLKKRITKNTKVVIAVHMLGTPARLDEIKKICKKNNIILIEDTAWGCGGKYKDKYLGTIGRMGTFSFDFAKSLTTGEGGMIVFQNKKDYLKAKAWHDHGHENNPKVPRWKDTRSGSGFNYRMSELQGAVGIAQLKKLNKIIMLQRQNAKKIIDKIKNFPGIELRDSDNNCFETFDSLIILFKNKNLAQKCRINLNKKQINTKILPEAKTWHFAKYWDHMPELTLSHKTNLKEAFKKSDQILERCVSIPISCKMSEKNIKLIVGIIKKILIK